MQDAAGAEIFDVRLALRRAALARRDALSESLRRESSTVIAAELTRFLESSGARFVHCYISFRSEVETRSLIEDLLARGIRVAVPVVDRSASESSLLHTEIQRLSNLRTGPYGIDEPVEKAEAPLERLDAVIIPIAAFDRSGARLGYGKGFYDRFLRKLPSRVQRIGLAFGVQEVAHIPILPHDERISTIITEKERITATASN